MSNADTARVQKVLLAEPRGFCAGVDFHVSRFGLRLEEGTPLPPWSMKTRELQARQHQNPRGIRVYGQNLEPQGLTLCFHSLAYGLAPLLLDTLW